jgi:hypothetical protein
MATIRKRDANQWQVRIRYKGFHACRTFRNKADGASWARDIETKIDQGKVLEMMGLSIPLKKI